MNSFRTLLIAAAAVTATAGTIYAQQTVYAIGNGGTTLIRFQSNDPSNVTVVGDFSGDNIFLDAIDFRPATGQLYGYLDSSDSFFTVDLSTARLTSASNGPSGGPTNTFVLGMDFNPTIDRARLVTESGQNIVYNPVAGTAAAFTNLFYGPGDPNEGAAPAVIENAYTNSFAGATTTQQYVIDYNLNVLATLANNAGTLQTVGPLGVDPGFYVGFDIYSSGGANTAYALLTPDGGSPSFYTVDLATGAASVVGSLGFTNQVYSLAVIPAPGAVLLLGGGIAAVAARRRRSIG